MLTSRPSPYSNQATFRAQFGFASSRHIYPRTLDLQSSTSKQVAQFVSSPEKQADGFRYELSPVAARRRAEDGSRLSLIQSQLSELRRQFEAELAASDRQVTLGSPCFNATDCSKVVARSHCRLDNFTCSCLPNHVELNSTTCLSRKCQFCN